MDCLFCKIADKTIPSQIVYEDDAVVAFLDIMPRSPGHTVVIAREHTPTLIELSDAGRGALFSAVKKVDELLVSKFSPDGMTIGINQGKAGGQEVDHLHVHLMPRWHNDGGDSVQSVVSHKPEESLEAIKAKLLG